MRRSCRRRRFRRGWRSSSLLILIGGTLVVRTCCLGVRSGDVAPAGARGARDAGGRGLRRRAAAAALDVDQAVQPAHLVLDLLQAVSLQLERVLVEALA